jgi:hypothetical protein
MGAGAQGRTCRLDPLPAINRIPRSRHEPRFAAGKDVQCPLGVALLRLRRFQSGKVPENFLLSAWRQIVPSLPRVRILVQFVAKPLWHWVGWATLVFMIELDRKAYNIADACPWRLPDLPVQIEKEAAVADRHQVDTPRHLRLTVDLDAHRHRLAPIALEPGGLMGAHEHVRIYVV